MNDGFLNLLIMHYRNRVSDQGRVAATFAYDFLDEMEKQGFTIVRTADLELAERKAAHGCTDALCGDCDAATVAMYWCESCQSYHHPHNETCIRDSEAGRS